VPADRSRELEAELTAVLVLLDDVHAECAVVVAQARRDAERIVATARGEAAAVADGAGRRARAARDEAAREVLPRPGPRPSALWLAPISRPREYATAPGRASLRWRAEPSALSEAWGPSRARPWPTGQICRDCPGGRRERRMGRR